jgi:hypothetical protein
MHRLCLLTLCLSVMSCATGTPDEVQPVIDAVTAPPLPSGTTEYKFPTTLIPPHTEAIHCHFMEPLAEDTYYSSLVTYQGKSGHHLVMFRALSPEPAGTVRDCSDVSSMGTLIPVMIPTTVGFNGFPDGFAIKAPKGTQIVWQQHYLNTGPTPLETRDVAHVGWLDAAKVRTTVGFLTVSDTSYSIPGEGKEVKLEMSCVVPADMNVLLLFPHMHEWGTRFYGYVNDKRMIDVPVWDAHYRDLPPTLTFTEFNPLVLKKGDVLKHECFFKNETGKEIRFPKEMCTTSGYYFPAERDWTCTSPTKVSFAQ